jgi:plasmid stabilization system protein ParE
MIPFRRRSGSISDALDYEIAQEQAAALGRAGRALETSLGALAEHDRNGRKADETRQTLVAAAGDALWRFLIQRECCGLRDPRAVMRDYRIPQEVQNRMGIFRARRTHYRN